MINVLFNVFVILFYGLGFSVILHYAFINILIPIYCDFKRKRIIRKIKAIVESKGE